VPPKVLDLDSGNLIEPEKALEGYGVYKGHHHSLTDPSPNPNAIRGSGEGGRPGRKWDPRVVFIQLSDLLRGYRLDAWIFAGPRLESKKTLKHFIRNSVQSILTFRRFSDFIY
jgi:hypothetical protein